MSISNIVTEQFILPISDVYTGWNIKKSLSFLQKSQWWSYDELKEFQNKRLRVLIKHAYNNVPYYKEIMKAKGLTPDDIQTTRDLPKLPIMTKELFKKNFPEKLTASNIPTGHKMKRSSSGSTGTPIQYYMLKEAYGFNKACNLRGWYWMGFRLGDKLVKISQNQRSTFLKRMQDKLDRTQLFSQSYTKENFKQFIDDFNSFKPSYLRSYPDPIHFLSQIMQDDNIQLTGLKAINTTGNILFPEVRELVEDRFNTRIFDSYSCEGGPNFFECETHECYHSSMEYGVAEILNDEGAEVGPGEQGRLYTTDLWNLASPFIRYDSKDVVVKSKNKCSCGRELLSISQVIGRDNDIIIAPNGKYLIAQTFTTYFKYIPSIIQFQIYQQTLNDVEIRIKVDETFKQEIKSEIRNYWIDYMGKNCNIEVKIMDEIPLAPSGKRRFLMRNNTIPFLIK